MPVAFMRDTWGESIDTINLKGSRRDVDLSFDRVIVVSKVWVASSNTSSLFWMIISLVASAALLLPDMLASANPARHAARTGIATIHRCRSRNFFCIAGLSYFLCVGLPGQCLQIRARAHPPDPRLDIPETDLDRMAWDLSAYPDNRASRAGWGCRSDVENNIFS